jgi:hypothetical protein
MSVELKIKAKHLALEPAIIKHEEKKLQKRMSHLYVEFGLNDPAKEVWALPSDQYRKFYDVAVKLSSLAMHRKNDVRNESRATNLARAYLKGFEYYRVEQNRRADREIHFKVYTVPRVLKMINKYGTTQEQRKLTVEQLSEWLNV